MDLILFYFSFPFSFLFFSGFFSELRQKCDVMSHVMVTQVKKCDEGVTPITVTVIESCNIKKVVKGCRIDDVIQYDNHMLALWQAHVL